jgi:Mrp family chromosome partitioning ATPase
MEKLQEALQKARDRRYGTGGAGGYAQMRTGAARRATSEGLVQQAWAALPEVPLDPTRLAKNRIVSMEAGRQATTFDILRTKVQLMMQKNEWTRLAITSPTPACGKTTMACNLALGLGRQKGLRTILIEFDLSRPMVAKMLGIAPPANITDMLSGQVDFDQVALRVRPNVAVAAAQRSVPDPTALLLAPSTQEALAEIEDIYRPDMMIFDLPPLLVSDETRAFLSNVDCALMLAKAESTTLAQIDTCEKEIGEQTNVLGMVLNQCRHNDDLSYGYDGYYYG